MQVEIYSEIGLKV